MILYIYHANVENKHKIWKSFYLIIGVCYWSNLLKIRWLLCLTPPSTIFQLYRGVRFIGGPEKTTDLSQVTDKLNVASSTSRHYSDSNS